MKRGHVLITGLALSLLAALLTACAPVPATPAEPLASEPVVLPAEETAPGSSQPVQLPTVTPSPPPTPTPALDPQVQQVLDSLGNQGPAPELTNDVWINSEPLRLADLRGKVVMVEFWTYG